MIGQGSAVARAQPIVRVRSLRERPVLRTEKSVQDETRFLKRLEMNGGHTSIRYNSVLVGLHQAREPVAFSLFLRKQPQPTASAPLFPDRSPARVRTPLLFFWCQKDTLREGALTLKWRQPQPHPSILAPPRTNPGHLIGGLFPGSF